MEKDVSEAKAKFLGVINITPEGWSQLENWTRQQQKRLDTEASLVELRLAHAALSVLKNRCEQPDGNERTSTQFSPCDRYDHLKEVYAKMVAA
ncbi:hypothetical protein A3F06_01695 [candidate division TM6 bacterium RIFCSPHIGHO2_12_FULL_36_22]|nr:MAG: hypothetical protein A3F06_01695 [candidate division TM6 bacterium RIFCSPHIGHO2_12_FULL_36_22]